MELRRAWEEILEKLNRPRELKYLKHRGWRGGVLQQNSCIIAAGPRRALHMQTSVCVVHFFTSIVRVARSIFDVSPAGRAKREKERVHWDLGFLQRTNTRSCSWKVFKVRSFARRWISLHLVASPYPRNTVFNIGQFKGSLRWLEHWHCRSFSLTVIGSQ